MSFWHNKLEINFLRVKSLCELFQMYFNEIYKTVLVLGGPQNYGIIIVQQWMRLKFLLSKQSSDFPFLKHCFVALGSWATISFTSFFRPLRNYTDIIRKLITVATSLRYSLSWGVLGVLSGDSLSSLSIGPGACWLLLSQKLSHFKWMIFNQSF